MRCCFIINPNSRLPKEEGQSWEEVTKRIKKRVRIKYEYLSDGTEEKCDSDRSDAYG